MRTSRLATSLMVAFGALALLVGGAALVPGARPSDMPPAVAAAVMLFGGALVVVGVALWRVGRRVLDPVPRQVAVTIPYDRTYVRAMTFASALFALAGAAMAAGSEASDDPGGVRIVGAVCAVTFGAFALLGLRASTMRRALVLGPDRLSWTGPFADAVGWDSIESVEVFRMREQPFLGIRVRPGAVTGRARTGGGALRDALSSMNASLTGFERQLDLNGLPVDPDDLVRAIEERISAHRRRTNGDASITG